MENITLGNISDILKFVATFITSSSIVCGLALAIGNKILKNALAPFDKRFDELTRIVDFNDIDAVRNRIVAFENLCRLDTNNDAIKLHQYKTYYKDEDKWAMYHKKYPELNGEINTAIESINEHYKNAKFD